MKFTIPEVKTYKPITEQQFHEALMSWMRDGTHRDKPEFCLMNPNTEWVFAEQILRSMYPFNYTRFGYKGPDAKINEYRGIKIIRSLDIPEGEFHLCGK